MKLPVRRTMERANHKREPDSAESREDEMPWSSLYQPQIRAPPPRRPDIHKWTSAPPPARGRVFQYGKLSSTAIKPGRRGCFRIKCPEPWVCRRCREPALSS